MLRRCVCDLETSRMGAPYIYDISRLRVNYESYNLVFHSSPNFLRYSDRCFDLTVILFPYNNVPGSTNTWNMSQMHNCDLPT